MSASKEDVTKMLLATTQKALSPANAGPKTRCEHHRDSLLGLLGPRGPRPTLGQFVPECDDAGNYRQIQCHASIGQCWCVNRNGEEIPGTRVESGSRPNCK
uniref:Thyroglobulin type-1 domain-containing protein n=1 Tax=Paramormyrops kingsleyae TaxID=1676925 RepID=A0A3B3QPV1_9TELE